jgi:hypothetical protein
MPSTISQPKATEKFKGSFAGSIKSLVSSGSRTYFVIEYKNDTHQHKTGQRTEVIGDYVEMGRGNSYAINFGEDCTTVSRPHAAIIRKDNGWVLRPLSQTNPTFLNNQQVQRDMYLNNGDEIQLSTGGPRMAFLVPSNNKVSTMGMTNRLRAVANEAIRPYRKTIATLAVVLVVAISGLSYYTWWQHKQDMGDYHVLAQQYADSLRAVNARNGDLQKQLVHLAKEVKNQPRPRYSGAADGVHTSNGALQQLYPSIYFILSDRITYETSEGTHTVEGNITGSGFLLSDGTFVTARHMVEPWLFPTTPNDSLLNLIANNMTKVTHHFTAYSPNGSKLTLSSENFKVDNSHDKAVQMEVSGQAVVLTVPSLRDGYDWAACKVQSGGGGGLAFDQQMAAHLPASSTLYILGYPFGLGVNNASDIKPIYSECKVSRDDIDHGVIDISGRGFDHGNSGGPVFAMNSSGNYVVVGIVSAGQEQQGFIVPISAIQ